MGKKWLIRGVSADCTAVAQHCSVPPIIARLLLNRDVSIDGAAAFLGPQLKDLHAPCLLPGAAQASEIIADAIRAKAKIVVYGDYDVDGTTGIAILWHVLTLAGADVSFYVPHRIDEGYGLNTTAVLKLMEDGADLIVSVDCGITAVEVANVVREKGTKLIITDHHTVQGDVPQADALVHPAIGTNYPNPHLCGAGVAFKLAWAVAQKLSDSERVSPAFRRLLMDLLPLAALGTIADVVPLRGENRIIAKHGLAALSSTELPGLRALIDSAGLGGETISGYDVGFRLAPRINAAGRMGHARLAVELLTRADAERAREIALYLEEHNRSRQAVERKITKQACEQIERNNLAGDARRAIVLASEGWHAGVIGIVAARIVGRFHRPTILIALTNGAGQGSARSISGFDLSEGLKRCSEHLQAYGGHAMAAGLKIAADRVDPFTQAFVQVANNRLTADDLLSKLHLDAEVGLDELTLPTVEAVVGLGPFGTGNPKPKLATDWVDLAAEPRCVGRRQDHLQASFTQRGVRLKAIGFGMGDKIEDLKQHRRCRVAFEPMINEFNGRRSVEMQILDLKFPE